MHLPLEELLPSSSAKVVAIRTDLESSRPQNHLRRRKKKILLQRDFKPRDRDDRPRDHDRDSDFRNKDNDFRNKHHEDRPRDQDRDSDFQKREEFRRDPDSKPKEEEGSSKCPMMFKNSKKGAKTMKAV